jgi:type VI secretion system protein ImpH
VAPQEWQSDPPLIDRLLSEFYSFSFYKAVHLLESLFPEKKRLGETLTPAQEPVRFAVKPGFQFPPSDIAGMEQDGDGDRFKMEVAFLGLVGPSGVLPQWINELAIQRNRNRDFSFTEFLDIFHHRLVTLFYLAWKRHRFPENYLPGARDRLSRHLLCLIGLGTPGLANRLNLPLESLIFHSGLLSRPSPCVAAIESTVRYFSDTSVNVQQFINRLVPVDVEDQTQLGAANGNLGVNAVCGSHAWESQTKFRVDIGPLGYRRFLRFLPSGEMLRPVFSLVRYMVGIEYEFDIGVLLKRQEVPTCTLGMETPESPRLGWSTWVKHPDFTHREDPLVVFEKP